MKKPKKIVLAYSGGLDTSVMLHWLKKEYACPVIAFAADIGQEEELAGLREKALATGASDVVICDLKEEFARDFVFPALQGSAIYEGGYLLGTSLARPIIAKKQLEIAREFGADAVAHGATGKGNDQVRFELTYAALDPSMQVIAPWRSWPLRSRSDLIKYAEEHRIPVTATLKKPYSTDRNLVHISFEGGILEDPSVAPPNDMFLLTRPVEETPDIPEYVEIGFQRGIPTTWNGASLGPVELLNKANATGGRHGIGRIDIVENRFVGMKSRGVYETPGLTILHAAHSALELVTVDREVLHIKKDLSFRFAKLIYNGFWYAPEFSLLQNCMAKMQENVTGTVQIKLFKGGVTIQSRKSPFSLYDASLATFEQEDVYQQQDAEGFIKLQALRLKNYHRLQRAGEISL